jgi:hypothetical protein
MIRVNLLRNRKEGLQRLMAEPCGASTFVSGREVLVAALFLALGGAILWFVLGHSAEPDPAVVAENVEPAPSQSSGEASARPAEVAAGRSAPTPVVQSPPLGSSLTSPPSAAPPPAAAMPAATNPSPPATGSPRGSTLLSERSSAASALDAERTAPTAGISASAGVITMSALRILGQGDNLQIVATTNGRPDYKMFRVDNPDRVVIDLAGVRHEISRENREQLLSNSIVKEVRLAQNQIEPPMVRLVLVVESFPELQILTGPDGLLINVTGK